MQHSKTPTHKNYPLWMIPLFRFFEGNDTLSSGKALNVEGKKSWSIIFYFVVDYRKVIFICISFGILASAIDIGKVLLLTYVIDAVTAQNFKITSEWIIFSLSWVIFLYIVLCPILNIMSSLFTENSLVPPLQAKAIFRWHQAHLRQNLPFFRKWPSGQIAARTTQAASAVRTAAALLARNLPYGMVQFVGAMLLAGYMSIWLALPIVVWVALNIGLVVWMIPRYARIARGIASATSKLQGHMVDSYVNMATVKSFNGQSIEELAVVDPLQGQKESQIELSRFNVVCGIIIDFLNSALVVIVVGIGLSGLYFQEISLGAFAASVALALRLVASVDWFFGVGQAIAELSGTLKDALSVFSSPNEQENYEDINKPDLQVKQGKIEFRNIYFKHLNEQPIYQNFSLCVSPGEHVGIVGVSGVGKSTLVGLLLRLYKLDDGKILIDDQDIQQVNEISLRQAIGIVDQDPSLFNRSIRDNILYGNQNADMLAVHTSASKAQADSFIKKLADRYGHTGYNVIPGERGMALSGGQRQRICIARLFLKNSPIVVMDEPTSALDAETERNILEAMKREFQNKTTIVLAHRLSTIINMDRIIILKDGAIVEEGDHKALMQKRGIYYELWQKQVHDSERDRRQETAVERLL